MAKRLRGRCTEKPNSLSSLFLIPRSKLANNPPAAAPRGRETILVVEDDHKTARFLKQGLEEEGHAVDVAAQSLDFVGQVADLEQVVHPLEELQLVDRLAEEVVAPGHHGPLDVAQFVQGRDHHDGNGFRSRVFLDLLAHFKPAHLRHHHVQQNQVGDSFTHEILCNFDAQGANCIVPGLSDVKC